ncbi:MAG: hypothetical protein AAGN66_24810, partial [Acidobacteriota bacterium]
RAGGEVRAYVPRAVGARVTLGIAEVHLAAGQLERSERRTREALVTFELHQDVLSQAKARGALARIVFVRGDLAAARAEVELARRLLDTFDSPTLTLPMELIALRIRNHADAGDLDGLQALLADVTAAGMGRLELETRLVLGEAEILGGYAENGRQRLRTVAQEARLKGFEVLAAGAEAATALEPLEPLGPPVPIAPPR